MNLMGEPANVGRHCGSNVYTSTSGPSRFSEPSATPTAPDDAPPCSITQVLHLGQWYLKNL